MIPVNLQSEERKLFTETIAKIVAAIAPEKIICYGNRIDCNESWSSFLPIGNVYCLSYYDVLIVTKEGDNREVHEILSIVDTYNVTPIHITAVVRGISAVNQAIRDGNPFFVTMYHKGMTVYDSYNVPLAIPDAELDEQKLTYWAESDWNRLFVLAKKYHTIAGMCMARSTDQLNDMSVLMLHQAAEITCRAIIRYYTGYRFETHDLRRHLWIMRNFTLEGESAFPQSTKEELEIFDTLDNAYGDVRNGHDYKPPTGIVLTLLSRVRGFMEIAEKLYLEKRNSTQKTDKT
jgi:HEPN domain-containing protein